MQQYAFSFTVLKEKIRVMIEERYMLSGKIETFDIYKKPGQNRMVLHEAIPVADQYEIYVHSKYELPERNNFYFEVFGGIPHAITETFNGEKKKSLFTYTNKESVEEFLKLIGFDYLCANFKKPEGEHIRIENLIIRNMNFSHMNHAAHNIQIEAFPLESVNFVYIYD